MLYHRHCHLFVGGVAETEYKKDIGVVEQGVTMNSEEFAGGVHAVPAVHVYLRLF